MAIWRLTISSSLQLAMCPDTLEMKRSLALASKTFSQRLRGGTKCSLRVSGKNVTAFPVSGRAACRDWRCVRGSGSARWRRCSWGENPGCKCHGANALEIHYAKVGAWCVDGELLVVDANAVAVCVWVGEEMRLQGWIG
jgi:hypothetical protein